MSSYRITHHYLTLDDEDQPVIEVEDIEVDGVDRLLTAISVTLDAPGGRSGTTVALHVAALDSVTI